jgi:hypothetical protein
MTKFILALLAACGVPNTPSAATEVAESPETIETPPLIKDHYWCCGSLGTNSGEDCTEIAESQAALCAKVLYCDGNYTNDEGKVSCN